MSQALVSPKKLNMPVAVKTIRRAGVVGYGWYPEPGQIISAAAASRLAKRRSKTSVFSRVTAAATGSSMLTIASRYDLSLVNGKAAKSIQGQ
jgi:hypothetical protein